jgi:DNA-binding transcriptional LysR family regulator
MESLRKADPGHSEIKLGETPGGPRAQELKNFRISLKQWRMLHAVVDCGGYSNAAEFLNLSQSAISYTIAKLQDQLGIPLLQIEGRKAQITEAGRAMLERSRHLIKDAIALEQLAENLRKGGTSEIRLVVDHSFPTKLLMLAIREFSLLGHRAKVSLNEVSMSEAEKALGDRTADLAISSQVPSGFLGNPLIDLEYIAVAHPNHPLLKLGREVTAADLDREIQIVIRTPKDAGNDIHKPHLAGHAQTWTVSSADTALSALGECLGYAWLPRHRVHEQIDDHTLAMLPLIEESVYRDTLYLIYGRSWQTNSGTSRLAEVLRNVASKAAENMETGGVHSSLEEEYGMTSNLKSEDAG